jgi:RNA polymerase primary sigma factor
MSEVKQVIYSENQESSSLSYYLNEISKIPLLTREEEESLATLAKNGDKKAKEKLIRANLRFVVTVAKKYRNRGIPLADLINEGNMGLITAIDKFEVERGFHFISYAVWWIRQAILKAICERSRAIRLPLNRANELVQIEKAKRFMEIRDNVEPTPEEIAKELSMDKDLVKHLLNVSRETISLETPAYEDKKNSSCISDFITDEKFDTPEEEIEKQSLHDAINKVLNTLTEKEKQIIEYRYGLNGNKSMSLKQIGEKYDLTKERIRQIEKKALVRLRHSSRSDKLRAFIES